MTPDIERAAIAAAETLIRYSVTTAPVDPIRILKSMPNVMLVSYTEMAGTSGVEREQLMSVFGDYADTSAFVRRVDGELRYLIAYNMRLPIYLIQRAMARELAHIVLGHDGSREDGVRTAEAQVFAYHLICPRALVRAIQESNVRFSTEVLGNMTSCFERCLAGMSKVPGVRVPAALNRQIRAQFSDYIDEFVRIQPLLSKGDDSRLADFGSYMDLYEE